MTSIVEAQRTAGTSEAAVHARKIIHAAHEFEGVLINTMLGPLEQVFASLPGKQQDAESDNYHYLGMQALSSVVASGGGLGIADLIIRKLLNPDGVTHPTK